jgi:hypothetical protein
VFEERGNVIVEISSLVCTGGCMLQMDETAFVAHYGFQGGSKSKEMSGEYESHEA